MYMQIHTYCSTHTFGSHIDTYFQCHWHHLKPKKRSNHLLLFLLYFVFYYSWLITFFTLKRDKKFSRYFHRLSSASKLHLICKQEKSATDRRRAANIFKPSSEFSPIVTFLTFFSLLFTNDQNQNAKNLCSVLRTSCCLPPEIFIWSSVKFKRNFIARRQQRWRRRRNGRNKP